MPRRRPRQPFRHKVIRNELLLRHSPELPSVLRTDWLAGVLLPDGVCASDRLLRLHGVSRCRVLWCREVCLSLRQLHDRSLRYGHDRVHRLRGCRTLLRIRRLNSVVLRTVLHRTVLILLSRLVHRLGRLRLRIGLLHLRGLPIALRCTLLINLFLR